MASSDSRYITPFFPSLCHFATVRLAVPLFKRFGRQTLDRAFAEIEAEDDGDEISRSAKSILLLIEESPRRKVMQAVRGMHCSINYWKFDHLDILRFTGGEYPLHWRPDGSIDTMRIAQLMVEDENIGIVGRFEIACKYFLRRHIETLWEAIRPRDITRYVESNDNWIVRFWVRWLRDESDISCWEAVARYLHLPENRNCLTLKGRHSAFFPHLLPRDRQRFLLDVVFSTHDDLRFCLYAMTLKEQEQLLRRSAMTVLRLHMKWPLRHLFLETADRLWQFIDGVGYDILLYNIHFFCRDRWEDFDYFGLFIEFWNRSPPHLEESARRNSDLTILIDQHLYRNAQRN